MRSELMRRAGPFGAIAGLISTIATAGLLVLGAYQSNELRVTEALQRYDKLAAIAASEDVLEGRPNAAADALLESLYLGNGQPAVVSANLLTLLEQLAANQGIAVNRESAMPARQQGSVTRVGGAMAISGSLPAIYGFLEQIEAARPALFIDRVDIRVGQTGIPEDQADTIASAEIEISGLIPAVAVSEADGGL